MRELLARLRRQQEENNILSARLQYMEELEREFREVWEERAELRRRLARRAATEADRGEDGDERQVRARLQTRCG